MAVTESIESELGIYLFDLDSMALKYLGEGGYPVWSPDGKWIAAAAYLYSVADGQKDILIEKEGICFSDRNRIAWSLDGKYVAVINSCEEYVSDSRLYIVDVESGRISPMHSWDPLNFISQPVWTP